MDVRPPTHFVSPRARLYWAVEGLILTVVLVAVLVVWTVFGGLGMPWTLVGAGVILLVFAGGALLTPYARYRIHRWEVTGDAVYTQRGWLTIEQRIAPISRVQTVDTERGALARLFGLSTVTVTTASAKGELKIEGLDRSVAEDIVRDLTVVTAASPGDAT
ncbi:PH domain-containing protein [Flexivirga sp. ID2601S]|uniref:PH domain-containing protein n=1 Tax=Flexivirga aerilata TaxID=1656889 RepID=A0A849A9W6_9MICO|nr:PH domain-containing protein [Flexivirga aerilata]NNG37714.1 PH domain-containing protein [Flexivirga aerilata]